MDSFFFLGLLSNVFFFLFLFFFFFLLFSQYFFYLFFYKEYSDLYLNCHLVLFCFFKRNIKNKSNVPFCKFLLICMLIILQLNFHLSFRFCIKFEWKNNTKPFCCCYFCLLQSSPVCTGNTRNFVHYKTFSWLHDKTQKKRKDWKNLKH